MRRYEMYRRPQQPSHIRAVQYDEATGVTYVYVRQDGWVDVFKFSTEEVQAAESGTALLEASAPSYRVEAGGCTCPGFEFRGKCRHTEHVRYLFESRKGWNRRGAK